MTDSPCTVSRLPFEILCRIFECIDYLDRDEGQFPEVRQSHPHLRAYALVHSAWTLPAQTILWRTLIFRDQACVERWLASERTRGKGALATWSLSVAGYGPSPERVGVGQLDRVAHQVRGVRSLHLRHPEAISVAVLTNQSMKS